MFSIRKLLFGSSPSPRPMSWAKKNPRVRFGLEQLENRVTPSADPVLLVIPNTDFWYQDYADTRTALEGAGIEVHVAAATTDLATPQWGSGFGSDGGFVQPDLSLTDVRAEDYSAIAFVGGWGASSYQYAFEGTYHNGPYNGDLTTKQVVNDLIGDFVAQDKHVAGVCYGVTVLAWARVDGASPLDGKNVTGWHGWGPSSNMWQSQQATWNLSANGGIVAGSGTVGATWTSADDVIVDGRIITAENFQSATRFGEVLAEEILAAVPPASHPETEPVIVTPETSPQPEPLPGDVVAPEAVEKLPVLMVIANQDFYYREYSETREAMEAAGLSVQVAAGTVNWCQPHTDSGQGDTSGLVMPDLALANADASDYSAIVFVGGWGASSYQYAFEGTYSHGAYNGSDTVQQAVNDLINDFVDQDKYVAAICHGVTVLAYARVDGVSPLEGRTVSSYAGYSPSRSDSLPHESTTRWQVESNGATMVASGSIGEPGTAHDDVIVDGRIITAENYDSSTDFGREIARLLFAEG